MLRKSEVGSRESEVGNRKSGIGSRKGSTRAARYTSAMVSRSLFFAFVLSVSLAYGQLDSNSITITASRNTAVEPDQVVFSVGVSAGLNSSLDDVLAALAGSGITS